MLVLGNYVQLGYPLSDVCYNVIALVPPYKLPIDLVLANIIALGIITAFFSNTIYDHK